MNFKISKTILRLCYTLVVLMKLVSLLLTVSPAPCLTSVEIDSDVAGDEIQSESGL